MFIRLVVCALISVIAIGCGATQTEKPDSTQGESQSVVESPKTTTAVPPTPLPPTAVPPTAVPPTAVPPTAVPPTAVPPTAVPPTAVPPTAVPTPAPVTLTGEGKKATEFFELEKGLWVVEFEHDGSSNFIVKLLDSDGDRVEYLANEIGSFEGSSAIKIDKSAAYLLDVDADGSWSIGFKK